MTEFYRFKADSDAWEYEGLGQTATGVKPGPYTQWWADHVMHTTAYTDASFAKDNAKAVGAVRGLWNGVLDWGCLFCDDIAAALMGEHAMAVKFLADSAAIGLKQNEADYITDYLVRNLEMQTAHYKSLFPAFPADEWKNLFKEHITATGARILALSKGDKAAADEAMKTILSNRDKIAAFSNANFPVQRFGSYVAPLLFGVGFASLMGWLMWRNRA